MIQSLVLRETPTYDYAQSPSAPPDEYVTCVIPDKDAGLEGSCSYKKRRKDSVLTDSNHQNGTPRQNSTEERVSSRY